MRCTIAVIAVALACVLAASTARADRLAQRAKPQKDSTVVRREKSKFHFGGKIGMVGPGNAKVEEYDVSLSSGTSFGLYLDLPSRMATCAAVSVDWHKIKPERFDDSRYLADFSLNLKLAMRGESRSVRLQPGLGLGYGHVAKSEGIPSAGFLVVKGYLDAICPVGQSGMAVLIELGLIAAPYGKSSGDSEYDLSADPRLLLRLGVMW